MNKIIKRIQNGEKYLLDDLIKQNMDYIYSFTNKYKDMFEDYDELVQEAIIAFIEAVYKYEFKNNFLNPYASIKIYYIVNKYVQENLHKIYNVEQRYEIVKKMYDNCKKHIEHEPTYKDISLYYRLDRSCSSYIMELYNNKNLTVEINDCINYYKDYSLEEVDRKVNNEILLNRIKRSNLTKKQKEVVLKKFGFIDGKTYTFDCLAKEQNLKKQAMHHLYKCAEKKLKLILIDER